MKLYSRHFPAFIIVLSMLFLCACSSPDNPVVDPDVRDLPTPSEYDFSGIILPEMTRNLSGFESAVWGTDPLETISESFPRSAPLSIVNSNTQMAGLDFQAWYTFRPVLPSSNETAEWTLSAGFYIRPHYLSSNAELNNMTQGIADFNLVLAYLSGIYGVPTHCVLRFAGDRDSQPLSSPLTMEQFSAEGVLECVALWSDSALKARISLWFDSYGTLGVQFIPIQQDLLNR